MKATGKGLKGQKNKYSKNLMPEGSSLNIGSVSPTGQTVNNERYTTPQGQKLDLYETPLSPFFEYSPLQ